MTDERDKGLKDDTKLARFVAGCQCVGGAVHVAFFHDAGSGEVGANKVRSCGPESVPTSRSALPAPPRLVSKTRPHPR
jgi:hypothetical protein